MKVIDTHIEGLKIIEPRVFEDARGFFFESYNKEVLKKNGIETTFLQDNLSKSQKNVLRGLHFQKPPFDQVKLVQVIKGAVYDVAVDIRVGSPTFGQYYGIELSEYNKKQFYIPSGFAHGFLTLEDNTIFSYKCSNVYNVESEGSIKWDDEKIGIKWNCNQPIISDKDAIAPSFENFKSPF